MQRTYWDAQLKQSALYRMRLWHGVRAALRQALLDTRRASPLFGVAVLCELSQVSHICKLSLLYRSASPNVSGLLPCVAVCFWRNFVRQEGHTESTTQALSRLLFYELLST